MKVKIKKINTKIPHFRGETGGLKLAIYLFFLIFMTLWTDSK